MTNKITFRVLSFIVLLSLFQSIATAQVKGLSYTLAPFAERTWTDDQSGIGNGFLAGAQLGLGFGQFVELRGIYSQGFNLSTDIAKFGVDLTGIDQDAYVQRDVDLKRYGTEMKLNLLTGPLLPYITLGTGIQSLEADSLGSSKQVYINTGLGIKFSAANRYTIGLQALRTSYRANPVNAFMDDMERAQYNIVNENFSANNISDWSVRASLVLYLGGRNPDGLTDIDKAYLSNFSGGFSGLSIPVEPTVMKIDFHEDLNLRDTWMAGGSAGINIGPLVGFRGFYWRALEEGSATKFDGLTMYGGEARFKLNEGKGFTPWLTLGGGEINISDDYVGRNDAINIEDKPFAMAGLGVDLPFNKYVKATGFARTILTSADEVANVVNTDDITNSWSYGVSLNFILGKKANSVKKAQQNIFDSTNDLLKSQYEDQIDDLEKQLIGAVNNSDIDAVKQIEQEKANAQKIISDLNEQSVRSNNLRQPAGNNGMSPSEIRLSPSEFQLILRDIIDGLKSGSSNNSNSNGNNAPVPAPQSYNNNGNFESELNNFKMEQRLESMNEKLYNMQRRSESLDEIIYDVQSSNVEMTQEIRKVMQSFESELKSIQRKLNSIELKNKQIDRKLNKSQTNVPAGGDTTQENPAPESRALYGSIDETNDRIDNLELSIIGALEDLDAGYASVGSDDMARTKTKKSKKPFQSYNSNSNTVAARNQDRANTSNEGLNFFEKFQYRGMSTFAGFNVGGNATANIGYRLHYGLNSKSNTEFMPETFFGLGSPTSFGIMANVTRSFPGLAPQTLLKPYIGVGGGLMKVGSDLDQDQLKGAYNLLIGSYLKVMNGDLYVDFTTRNLFSYNQLIVGYRLPF